MSTYVSAVLGSAVDGRRFGTLRYPPGTGSSGEGVLRYLLTGTRATAVIGLVTATVVVPLATAVGTVAAYTGSLADDLSMRFVDVVRTVPPVIACITATFVLGDTGSLVLMVAVFSLLSWGSVARRSVATPSRGRTNRTSPPPRTPAPRPGTSFAVISRRSHRHRARGDDAADPRAPAGGGRPLVSHLGARYIYSWDTLVRSGTSGAVYGSLLDTRWISLVPAVTLALTVLSLGVLGETVDPRTG